MTEKMREVDQEEAVVMNEENLFWRLFRHTHPLLASMYLKSKYYWYDWR